MRFTSNTKLFNIGDEIFPTDFSSFSVIPDDESDFRDEELSVKAKLDKGNPLIVVSEPYLADRGIFDEEWYINVKFEDSDKIYSIFNSDTNVFSDWYDYICYVVDCEECFAFGY